MSISFKGLISEGFADDIAKSTYEWAIGHGGVLTPNSDSTNSSIVATMQRKLTDKQSQYCQGGGQFVAKDGKKVMWKRSTGTSILFFILK